MCSELGWGRVYGIIYWTLSRPNKEKCPTPFHLKCLLLFNMKKLHVIYLTDMFAERQICAQDLPGPIDTKIKFFPWKNLRSSRRDPMKTGIALHCDVCYNNKSLYKVWWKFKKQKQMCHWRNSKAGNLHTLRTLTETLESRFPLYNFLCPNS